MGIDTKTANFCPQCFTSLPALVQQKTCDDIAKIFNDRHRTLATCNMNNETQQERMHRRNELSAIADDLSIYLELVNPGFSRLGFNLKCKPNR